MKFGIIPTNFFLVFAVFSLVLLPTALFWMSFGRAILSGESKQIKADLLYKGSAMLLLVCMFPDATLFAKLQWLIFSLIWHE